MAKNIILGIIRSIDYLIKLLQILRYELTYKFHLKVRSVHDTLVIRVPVYKKATEHKLAVPVRNATVSAFLVSFLLFTFVQYVLPNLNLFTPNKAYAGSNSKTWTTNADFRNNKASYCVEGNPGTNIPSNVVVSGTTYSSVNNCQNQDTNNAADLSLNTGPFPDPNSITSAGSISTGNYGGMTADPTSNKLYVANYITNKLDIVNTLTNTVTNSISTGNRTREVAINQVSRKAYVTVAVDPPSSSKIVVIDLNTETVIKSLVISNIGGTLAVNLSTNKIYATSGSSLYVIDGVTDTIIKTLSLGTSNCYNAAIGTNTDRVYLGCSNYTVVIRTDTDEKITSVYNSSLNIIPHLVVNSITNKVYLANGALTVLDGNTNQYESIPVVAKRVAIQPSNNQVYAIGGGGVSDNQVNIIDGNTKAVLATKLVTSYVGTIEVNRTTNKIYVTSSIYGGISVLNNSAGYLSPGVVSGFKVSAQSVSRWGNISWQETSAAPALTNSSYLRYRTRGADTDAALSTSTWSNYTDFKSGASGSAGILTSPSSYLEIELTLTSTDGQATPYIDWFKVDFDSLDSPTPTKIYLSKTDGSPLKNSSGVSLPIASDGLDGDLGGGYISESSIVVTATSLTCGSAGFFCSNNSTNRYISVQASSLADTAFETPLNAAGSSTRTSNGLDGSAGTVDDIYSSSATITGLVANTKYHIRVATKDAEGRISGWRSYSSDGTAFTVEQTTPGVSILELQDSAGNPIVAKNGVVYAKNRNIKVKVQAQDTGTAGYISNLSKIFLTNKTDNTGWSPVTTSVSGGNFTGSATYTGTVDWQLDDTEGAQSVSVRVTDNAGNGEAAVTGGSWTTNNDFNGVTQGIGTTKSDKLTVSSDSVKATLPVGGVTELSYGLGGTTQGTSGTFSWNAPADLGSVSVELYGSGGGGDDGAIVGGIGAETYIKRTDNANFKATAFGGGGTGATGNGNIAVGGFTGLTVQASGTGNNGGAGGTTVTEGGQGNLTYDNGSWECPAGFPNWDGEVCWDDGWYEHDNEEFILYTYAGCDYGSGPFQEYWGDSETTCSEESGSAMYWDGTAGGSTTTTASGGGRGGSVTGSIPANQLAGRTIEISVGAGGALKSDGTGTNSTVGAIGKVVIRFTTQGAVVDGTLGATGVGLRYGSDTGPIQTWASLGWSAAGIDGNNYIGIMVRPSGTFGTGTYVNPATNVAGSFYELHSGTTGDIPISASLLKSKTIEIQLLIHSDGVGIPTLNDLTLGADVEVLAMDSANITLDPVSPASYTLVSPADNAWSGNNLPTLTWQASADNPGSGLYKYELYMDGVLQKTIDNTTVGATANILSATPGSDVSYTLQTGEEISEKMHPWYVRAYDKALNTTDSTRGVSNPLRVGYDSSLPNTLVTTDISAQASGWFTASPQITLTATDPGTTDGSGVSEVKYRWDNSDLTSGATTYSAAFSMTATVGDGTHVLYFRSKDTAGNYESVKQQTYKLDTVKPNTDYAISDTPPNGNNQWYVGTSPTIILTPRDEGDANASGIASTKYQWVSHDAQPGATWQTGTSFTAPLGDKTLYYYSTDVAGNDGAQYEQQHVKFDNVSPISPTGFDAPTDKAYTDSIYLKWFGVSDTSGVQTYQLRRKKDSDTWSSLSVVDLGAVGNITSYTDANGLEAGYKYTYQIKTQDNAGNWSDGWSGGNPDQVVGYTIDTVTPTVPGGVVAASCDGSGATLAIPDTDPAATTAICSASGNKGYEITLAWKQASDTGVGLGGYKIYRSAEGDTADETKWVMVGVLPWTGAEVLKWNDNETNNAATWDIGDYPSTHPKAGQAAGKTEFADALSDSTTYYYRVTAYDAVNNESALFPPIFPDPDMNRTLAVTPDVTAPGWFDAQGNRVNDAGVSAMALGLDGSDLDNENIGHQRIVVSWNTAIDKKHNGDVLEGSVPSYELYRSATSYQTDAEWLASATKITLSPTTAVTYEDNSLDDSTVYYYRVLTYDASANKSDLSSREESDHATTYDSNIPSAPSEVRVTAVKGDPNAADTQVGNAINISFKGSNSKYREIVRYEIYRYEADANNLNNTQWLDSTKTTKLRVSHTDSCGNKCDTYTSGSTGGDIEITANQDDRDNEYRILDTGLSDAHTYFYRVRAQDNAYVPNEPEQSYRFGPLSNISPLDSNEATRFGWDTTPDATAPDITASDLALSVKDTHPSATWLRNVVTWKVADKTKIVRRKYQDANCTTVLTKDSIDYCTDFARYEIHREVYDQTDVIIPDLSQTFTFTDINTNILVDSAPVAYTSDKFKYYMVIVDNADTEYKYANGMIINKSGSTTSAPNKTNKIYWNGSITPEKSHAVIDSVALSDVGVSSATVTWHTDQSTDSLVEYRPMKKVAGNWNVDDSSNNQFVAVGHRETDVNHSVYIFGMKPETKYEYRVISKNYPFANETVVSADLPELVTRGFIITYVPSPENISTVSADIRWTTNMPSNSNMVEYRESNGSQNGAMAETPLKSEEINNEMKDCVANPASPLCTHSVTLSPLKKNTEYTINIVSISLDNYTSTSGLQRFTTANSDSKQFTIAPSASNVAERNITSTSAQIVFQTSEATTATLYYDTKSGAPSFDPKEYKQTATDALKGTTHAILLDGLEPGKKYFYIVKVDNGLLSYTSPEASFTAVLKPKISNLKISDVKPYSFSITWDTNIDTETLINLGTSANYSEKRGKSGLTKVHELLVDGLQDNTEYHYQILAKDETGEEVASGDSAVRTPLDTEGPKITGVKVDILPMGESDTTSSIIVSWQTNKPASTLVEYDQGIIGGTYNSRSVEDVTLNNSHTVIVKGLAPASSYRYRLISKDKRSNMTVSQDYTFVTPTKEKSILQLILKSLEETFAWTKNLNQFFGNIGKRLTGGK